MSDPAFKEKLLKEKPNFASEIEKSMNEQGSAKSKEEIQEAASLGQKLISNYETQFILGDPPNYEPGKEDSIAALAETKGVSELEVIYDEFLKNGGTNLVYACFTPYDNHKLDFVERAYSLKSSVAGEVMAVLTVG